MRIQAHIHMGYDRLKMPLFASESVGNGRDCWPPCSQVARECEVHYERLGLQSVC